MGKENPIVEENKPRNQVIMGGKSSSLDSAWLANNPPEVVGWWFRFLFVFDLDIFIWNLPLTSRQPTPPLGNKAIKKNSYC